MLGRTGMFSVGLSSVLNWKKYEVLCHWKIHRNRNVLCTPGTLRQKNESVSLFVMCSCGFVLQICVVTFAYDTNASYCKSITLSLFVYLWVFFHVSFCSSSVWPLWVSLKLFVDILILINGEFAIILHFLGACATPGSNCMCSLLDILLQVSTIYHWS